MAERKILRSGSGKNKAPAQVQVTAEQILNDARAIQTAAFVEPRQEIADKEEYEQWKVTQRKYFEDRLRRNPLEYGIWGRYATWEAKHGDARHCTSVYERAISHGPSERGLWMRYADWQLSRGAVNEARNVLDRATRLLPQIPQLWYKYVHMEELLGELAKARAVFASWTAWAPPMSAWSAWVNMEMRYGKTEAARAVYERAVATLGGLEPWMKYAKWEERAGGAEAARGVWSRAVEAVDANVSGLTDLDAEAIYTAFAAFETRAGEYERARAIYRYALDNLPKAAAPRLYKAYASFEKAHGTTEEIEDVVARGRRFEYEHVVSGGPPSSSTSSFGGADVPAPAAYDAWFDYLRLEEAMGSPRDVMRDLYERAVAAKPLVEAGKDGWRRYVYLWIGYAAWEELEGDGLTAARRVWETALKVVPHDQFTFAKLWLGAAQAAVRDSDVGAARKLLGTALGKTGVSSPKLWREYIALEVALQDWDRVRALYARWLELNPGNVNAWTGYAQVEASLNETDRARAIYRLAVDQAALDMPEVLWKSFIDWEAEVGTPNAVRALYRELLARSSHVKVWMSWAQYEASIGAVKAARGVFQKAATSLAEDADAPGAGRGEERAVLFEAWVEFEQVFGTPEQLASIKARLPTQVRRRRMITDPEDDRALGWEEYWDYVFPDDAKAEADKPAKPGLDLLRKAREWKAKKEAAAKAAAAAAAAAASSAPSANAESESGANEEGDAMVEGEGGEAAAAPTEAAGTNPMDEG